MISRQQFLNGVKTLTQEIREFLRNNGKNAYTRADIGKYLKKKGIKFNEYNITNSLRTLIRHKEILHKTPYYLYK